MTPSRTTEPELKSSTFKFTIMWTIETRMALIGITDFRAVTSDGATTRKNQASEIDLVDDGHG